MLTHSVATILLVSVLPTLGAPLTTTESALRSLLARYSAHTDGRLSSRDEEDEETDGGAAKQGK